ncbi:MAG: hypothetical protein WCG47_04625, partial [Dermatophilaceae bacterium]
GYQLTQIDPTQPAQAITTIDAIPAQLQTHRARSPLGAGTPPAADPTHSPTDADDRPLSRPETTDEQQWGAEYATLGAAIHDHPRGSRAHVQACIVLDDFTRPDIRAGWQAVEQLQTIGLPVDEITVHWQLTHCATSGQRIPSLTMLRDSRQAASTHHEAVHTLTTASATRAITRLHTTLQALQTDQRPLAQTIDAITTSTQDVRCQTHRIESTACHQ